MIRPYLSSDKERLLEIFNLNTPNYFDENEVTDFVNYLKLRAATYLTMEVDNTIVGGAGYYSNENDRSGRITWIFFDPHYSQQGLGKQMVEYCLSILKKDVSIDKFVVTTSQHAYGFFEKFGFILIHIKKDHWGKGLDLYEMEMPRKNG